jgi:hypothetical protein
MMTDPIALGIQLLAAEAPKKDVVVTPSDDPRGASFTVPTTDGRKQVVYALAVADSLYGERLDLLSMSVREIPKDVDLLLGLLAISRNFRKTRICVIDRDKPQLVACASFLPDELVEGAGPRLLLALREVAAVADSLEQQLVGDDIE